MQFIVHPGKTIGNKLPVQKLTWYNKEFLKSLLEINDNKLIHYYKNKKSYVLSSFSNRNSVHVTLTGKDKQDIRVDYYESYTCFKTSLMLKKIIRQVSISKNDLTSLKQYAKDVVAFLISDTKEITKIPIHRAQQGNIFCYIIKSVDIIKQDDNKKYLIKTNNFLMSDIIIDVKAFIGNPYPFDVVIVKDNKHVCIERADFYKHYEMLY